MDETNIQGDLFNQPEGDQPKPADAARLELTPEADAKRARERVARQRRSEEAASKRQQQIERAAEAGVDLKTRTEIQADIGQREVRKAREATNRAIEDPEQGGD